MKIKKYLWIIFPLILAGLFLFVPIKIHGINPELYLNGIQQFKYLNSYATGGLLSCIMIFGGTVGKMFDI